MTSRMAAVLFVALPLAFLTVTAPLDAQVFRGSVFDAATGAGIEGALVEVLDVVVDSVVVSTTTRETGRFSIYAGSPGEYRLRVQRLGYGSVTTTAHRLEQDAVALVDLELSTEIIALEPINVRGERLEPPYMRDVRYRMAQGWGRFLAREDLEELQGRNAEQLVQEVPGVFVQRDAGGGVQVLAGRAQASFSGPCAAAVYVNGTRQFPTLTMGSDSMGIDGMEVMDPLTRDRMSQIFTTMASEIEAVEVYRGASQVPAEFAGLHAGCGVVAIWMRSGQSDFAPDPTPVVRYAPPAVYVLGSVGQVALSGDDHPDEGVALDLGMAWLIGEQGQLTFSFRRSSHDGGVESTDQVRTTSLGLEPRYYVVTGAVRPFVGVRTAWVRRTMDRPGAGADRIGVDAELSFNSSGWSYGAMGGLSVRMGSGLFLETTAFVERSSFSEYRFPAFILQGSDATWTSTGIRVGLSYLAIS